MLAVVVPSLGLVGALITTDRYIVPEGERVTEDQYVTSTSAVIDGVVVGNLTLFSGSLRINGTVTGSVTVFASGKVTVSEGGSVGGSLNGAAGSVDVRGTVGTDLFVAAGATVIEESGRVGRDAIGFGGTLRVEGSVDRDVRGRAYRITIDGTVDGDVDVAAQSLGVGPSAVIGGDVLYRAPSEAAISSEAAIGGTVTRLPTQGNFIYSLVLSVANVVSFLGFLLAGIVVIWIARGTSSRAIGSVLRHPVRSLLVGLVTVILYPLAVGLLAITLVGIPLAVALLAIGVVVFVIGAVPAVSALGNLVLFRRGGVFGAFVFGAVIWRLSFFIPWIGAIFFLLGLVWGIGAWVLGAIGSRRADPVPVSLFPTMVSARTEAVEDWDAPLAPGAASAEHPDEQEPDGEQPDRHHEEPDSDEEPVDELEGAEAPAAESLDAVPVERPDAESGQAEDADTEYPDVDVPDIRSEAESGGIESAGAPLLVSDQDGADAEYPDADVPDSRTEAESGGIESEEPPSDAPTEGESGAHASHRFDAPVVDGTPADDRVPPEAETGAGHAVLPEDEHAHAASEPQTDGDGIRFGGPEPVNEDAEEPSGAPEPLPSSPAAGDGLSVSERFQALRRELLATGSSETEGDGEPGEEDAVGGDDTGGQ
jgi:cytoskeletal protein CcmA (bactofilin family)